MTKLMRTDAGTAVHDESLGTDNVPVMIDRLFRCRKEQGHPFQEIAGFDHKAGSIGASWLDRPQGTWRILQPLDAYAIFWT
jgi:hypothetical protein